MYTFAFYWSIYVKKLYIIWFYRTIIGNTTYYSDDVWGYVPSGHVDLLATWVSEFPGNLEHKLISDNSENYDYDDDFFAGLNDVSV